MDFVLKKRKVILVLTFIILLIILSFYQNLLNTANFFFIDKSNTNTNYSEHATPEQPENWIDELQYHLNISIYSQYGQDGVLNAIFKNILTQNRISVEFGYDYSLRKMSQLKLNTYNLRVGGWNCTYFDAVLEDHSISLYKYILSPENIVSIFEKHKIPHDVDYVSIDVDSIDFWLLRALLDSPYHPRVISIEYNSNFPINTTISHVPKWHPWESNNIYGASAGALLLIANKYNYALVTRILNVDLFFVRKDCIAPHVHIPLPSELLRELPSQFHGPAPLAQVSSRWMEVKIFLSTGDEELAREQAFKQIKNIALTYNIKLCSDCNWKPIIINKG